MPSPREPEGPQGLNPANLADPPVRVKNGSDILGVLVSAQQPTVSEAPERSRSDTLRRLRWIFWGVALVVGVGAGALIGILRSSPAPAIPAGIAPAGPQVTWAAGKLPAPDFSLADENGKPVSLAQFHGRPVILTFIDPLCQDFCPTEAKILHDAVSRFPAAQRPAIVAVSVNLWGNARKVLVHDGVKWKLPSDWHWAIGKPAALKKVWADYKIGVTDTPKTVNGVTEHEVSHTEAAFLIDANGDQRELYLYPFRAPDVARSLRALAGTKG